MNSLLPAILIKKSKKMMRLKRQSLVASLSFMVILLLVLLIQFSTQPHSNPNLSLITTLNDDEKNQPLIMPNPRTKIMTLLVGIFTRPEKYDRRHLLRLIYNPTTFTITGGDFKTTQKGPALTTARIDVKFIICNLSDHDRPKIGAIVALEILRFGDILVLNCTENMNTGKTHTYFSSLPEILPRYDYVMKADDDVYLRLERLATSLERAPRADLYYGFVIPCPSMNPLAGYMSGMGYVLSWDVVEWIGRSGIPGNNTRGPEDKLVGQWLDAGKRGKNRVNNKPAMYDYPGSNGRCSHQLIPDTIAVHRLKKPEQWVHVLTFFNVTPPL